MEEIRKKKSLKKLIGVIVAELMLVAAAVWFFDPFYQYHKPFAGLQAVLNDRDNQMPGTVRNFDYDSVLVGSSLAENFDSSFLDREYGCQTLKVIKASGTLADLLYYLNMAQENHSLRNVFWCLDLTALDAPTEPTLRESGAPMYLHTKAVWDDIPYLYNKEILLKKIPSMLALSYTGTNTGGNAYNWAQDKEFSAAKAMLAYDRNSLNITGPVEQQEISAEKQELLSENLEQLKAQIESHPEITYRFLFPPYSMLWWDCAYVNGELELRFETLEQTLPLLLSYENVEVYYFQDQESIICDLDHYMDMIHYSPEINQYMLEQAAAGQNRVTPDNYQETLARMRALAQKISTESIFRYYDR